MPGLLAAALASGVAGATDAVPALPGVVLVGWLVQNIAVSMPIPTSTANALPARASRRSRSGHTAGRS